MKRFLVSAGSALMGGLVACGAATIENVTMTQLWPFSTDVRVNYTVSGAAANGADIDVTFYQNGTALTPTLRKGVDLQGELYGVADGAHSFTFNPQKVGTGAQLIEGLSVKLSARDAALTAAKASEVIYKLVDLDSGAITDVTRRDILNGKYGVYETTFDAFRQDTTVIDAKVENDDMIIWTGVTNELYKTQYMALRKINAKDYGAWIMGGIDCANSTNHSVTLTQDFWMGVFEVTQEQYHRISNSYGNHWTTNDVRYGDHRFLAAQVNWMSVRENLSSDSKYPAYTWPANQSHVLTQTSFLYNLQQKVGSVMLFDLPTEAQWEFATRAGTTTATYLGSSATLAQVGWAQASGNKSPYWPKGVGLYYPNAYGLYDTLGGVHEICLDYYAPGTSTAAEEDPVGVSYDNSNPKGRRVIRGRAYSNWGCYSCWRESAAAGSNYQIGFRVCCTIE